EGSQGIHIGQPVLNALADAKTNLDLRDRLSIALQRLVVAVLLRLEQRIRRQSTRQRLIGAVRLLRGDTGEAGLEAEWRAALVILCEGSVLNPIRNLGREGFVVLLAEPRRRLVARPGLYHAMAAVQHGIDGLTGAQRQCNHQSLAAVLRKTGPAHRVFS